MADPSPDDAPTGQEPEDRVGQEPDGGTDEGGQEPQGRTYSESYVKQLRREAAGARSHASELETKLKEFEDRDKTEMERATDRAADAERRAVEAETRALRYEIAAEVGLSLEAAAFLSGSTREEIELRAEELAKLLKDKQPTASFDGGARPSVPEQKSPEVAHNEFLTRALGRGNAI